MERRLIYASVVCDHSNTPKIGSLRITFNELLLWPDPEQLSGLSLDLLSDSTDSCSHPKSPIRAHALQLETVASELEHQPKPEQPGAQVRQLEPLNTL